MKFKSGVGFQLMVLILGGVLFAPAHAVFLITDCSETITTGVPEMECKALEALWDSTDGSGWTNPSGWDTNTPIDTWYNIVVTGGTITEIRLSQNNLVGTIPADLGNLSNLVNLNLAGNQLGGSIPVELGNLSNLEDLSLDRNQLSGSIPSELGDLGKLITLNLFDNQLQHQIPSTLGNLSSLTSLNIGNNLIIGTLPAALGNLGNLQFLSLGYNQISGSIPPELTNLDNLFNLVLTSNQLSGDVPDLSGMLSLNKIYFDLNKFAFEDFEPEHLTYKAKLKTYTYHPQDFVDEYRSVSITAGQRLTISPELDLNPSGNDEYQWYKNGIAIPPPVGTKRHYVVVPVSMADAGKYTYRVSNSVVSPMTLISHQGDDAIVVSVEAQTDFTVGGSISGLQLGADTLTLQNNGSDDNSLDSGGAFTFATLLPDEADYNVTVSIQPAGLSCSVSNGRGTIAAENVTDVVVSCVDYVPSECPQTSFEVVDQGDIDEEWYVGNARISGNGDVVVYECGDDICIKDFSTIPPTKEVLEAEVGFNSFYTNPDTNYDGNIIYYRHFQANQANTLGYVYYRKTGIKELVTVDVDGNPWLGVGQTTRISANGKYVVFSSYNDNLVEGDNNGESDVFRRDLVNAETLLISVSTSGQQGDKASGSGPSISKDLLDIDYSGDTIVFVSEANNFANDDSNGNPDVFVRDIEAGTTKRVGLRPDGDELYYGSDFPAINRAGTLVAFRAAPEELDAEHLFVNDLTNGKIKRISLSVTGSSSIGDTPGRYSKSLYVTTAGRFVFFESRVENLVEGDDNGLPRWDGDDLFVRDLETGQTRLLSYTPDENGKCVRADNYLADIHSSENGSFITYSGNDAIYRAGLDIRPPGIEHLDVTPPRGTVTDSFMFTADVSDNTAYIDTEFRLDNGAWEPVSFKALYAGTGTINGEFTGAGLNVGSHSLCLRVSDGSGNRTEQCTPFNILDALDFQPFSVLCYHQPLLPSPGEDVTYFARTMSATGEDLQADWIEIWVNDKTAPAMRLESASSTDVTRAATGDYNTYGCRAGAQGQEVFSSWRLHATDTYDASHAIPIIKTGEPGKRIDVVFIADSVTYESALNAAFLNDVSKSLIEGYWNEAWFRDNQNYFNFWLAREQGWADHPDNEGPCAHLMPGQLPGDPAALKDIWEESYAFSDVAAIIHDKQGIDCAVGGPPSFGARTRKLKVIRHESGHRPFGLADEYHPKGGHYQQDAYPNNYETLSACNADLANLNDVANECVSFENNDGKTFWLSDPDTDHLMTDKGIPRAADLRRMNWLVRRCKEGDC